MTVSEGSVQTVLYVDHDKCNRSAFAADLSSIGYQVTEASSADAAIAVLAGIRPSLIVCDDSLPDMSATELLKAVRENYGALDGTPFIVVSSNSDRKSALKLRELGADDVIVRPIDPDTVKATFQACLAQVKRLQRSQTPASVYHEAVSYKGQPLDLEILFSNIAGTLDGMSRGVIYLDGSGNIKNLNRTAEAILSEGGSLMVAAGRLCAMQPASARTLRDAIRAATADQPSSSVVPIPREAQAPLVVHICPLNIGTQAGLPTVAVIVVDPSINPPLSAPIIAKIYNLTRTEARIAVALADGNRLEQIAKQSNVSLATVSFHVQNLFRKTRTTRQSDLVALLMRSSISTPVLQIAA
ncbi:response regulator [Microvirga sp. 2YAF29]|uniref:response regulator n=1 Tax=Microvirga sp. 2YAF29 TaxID=3233031 RepID=UPI003F9770BF